MTHKRPKIIQLTDAQESLLEDIERYTGSKSEGVILFTNDTPRKVWRYFIAHRYSSTDIRPHTIYAASMKAVKELIRKGVLVPEISNKEWEVQVALGTMPNGRVYKLPHKKL